MRRLIWTEFHQAQLFLLGVFAIALAADLIWDVAPALSAIWAALLPVAGNSLVRRTNWYLMLPVARSQVIKQVALQNGCFLLEGLLLLYLEFSYFSFYRPNLEDRFVTLTGFSVFAGVMFLGTMTNPFMGAVLKRRALLPSMRSVKQVRYTLIGIALLATHFSLVSWFLMEPVFLWTLIASLFLIWPGILFAQFRLPIAQSRALIRRIGAVVLLIYLAPIVGSLVLLHAGSPQNSRVAEAASFLFRFPAFVSPDRALELFSKSQIGDEPAIAKHVETLRPQATEAVWVERTAKCRSQSCLSLSSDVADPAQLPGEKLGRFFTTIMDVCKLETRSDGLIRCTGPKLPQKQLDKWLHALVTKGVADQWLNGNTPQQQLIALKTLPVDLNESRLNQVRLLTASPDPLVRNTAIRSLSEHEIVRSAHVDCNNKDNSKHEVCRWKQEGESRKF